MESKRRGRYTGQLVMVREEGEINNIGRKPRILVLIVVLTRKTQLHVNVGEIQLREVGMPDRGTRQENEE